jgi:hypothetical protein
VEADVAVDIFEEVEVVLLVDDVVDIILVDAGF